METSDKVPVTSKLTPAELEAFMEWLPDQDEVYTEEALYELLDKSLDCDGLVDCAGLHFWASYIWKSLDEVAYRRAFSELYSDEITIGSQQYYTMEIDLDELLDKFTESEREECEICELYKLWGQSDDC